MTFSPELQPSLAKEVISKSPGILTIIAGPSTVGKTTVLFGLLEHNPQIKKVVSSTTRLRRLGECDGIDFNFLSENDFQRKILDGSIVEHVKYGENYYGFERQEIEPILRGEDRIFIQNMKRAAEMKEYYHQIFDPVTASAMVDRTLTILIGTSSIISLWHRWKGRGLDRNSFKLRMREDWDTWQNHGLGFDHVVINQHNNLESTIEQILALIEEKKQEVATFDLTETNKYPVD